MKGLCYCSRINDAFKHHPGSQSALLEEVRQLCDVLIHSEIHITKTVNEDAHVSRKTVNLEK